MSRRLRYFAQAIAADGSAKSPHEFVCALDAEDGGAILARGGNPVVVYQQWLDEASGSHEDPEILLTFGLTRPVAVSGVAPWEFLAA